MIDIHTHILPSVDDGSSSIEKSFEILNSEIKSGVNTIVCTPHYKTLSFEVSNYEIKETFNNFKSLVLNKGLKVNLLLGREYYAEKKVYEYAKSNTLMCLGNGKGVLLEFNYLIPTDIVNYIYNLVILGYQPIVAHIERYSYLKNIGYIKEIKENGGLIQANASSIIGESGKHLQKKIFNFIELGLVDFIASDIHEGRDCKLSEAYRIIDRKFGKTIAENLFRDNAKKLLII